MKIPIGVVKEAWIVGDRVKAEVRVAGRRMVADITPDDSITRFTPEALSEYAREIIGKDVAVPMMRTNRA